MIMRQTYFGNMDQFYNIKDIERLIQEGKIKEFPKNEGNLDLPVYLMVQCKTVAGTGRILIVPEDFPKTIK